MVLFIAIETLQFHLESQIVSFFDSLAFHSNSANDLHCEIIAITALIVVSKFIFNHESHDHPKLERWYHGDFLLFYLQRVYPPQPIGKSRIMGALLQPQIVRIPSGKKKGH